MIKIKNGKLMVAGISFSLPDEFYIDVLGIDCLAENFLRFVSVQGNCIIDFTTSIIKFHSAIESIKDVFVECEGKYNFIEGPEYYERNFLKGAHVTYESAEKYYYEIHYEMVEGFNERVEILIEIDKSRINMFSNKESIKNFLDSITLA